MRSNEEIIQSITNREDISISECEDAMREAQIEILNEVYNHTDGFQLDVIRAIQVAINKTKAKI